jgi:hypothetical protein
VEITDLENNTTMNFNSVSKAADHLKVDRKTISNYIISLKKKNLPLNTPYKKRYVISIYNEKYSG